MPLALGTFIATTIYDLGVGAATAAGIGNAVISAGWAGIAFAASSLAGLLTGSPSLAPEAQKSNIRQAVAPRRKYYGKVKVGGVYAFLKAKGGKLYYILMIGQGPFNSFEEHWIGDTRVTLDGSGFVTDSQFSYKDVKRIQIVPQLGAADQTAHPVMTAAWSGVWTSNHRLRGVANALVVSQTVPADKFTGVYKSGVPVYRTVAETALCWDPTDEAQDPDDPSTWTYTQNFARILLDHAWADYGRRIPRALFEGAIDDWQAKIAICDQAVTLAGGGSEPRFQAAGGYGLDEAAKNVGRAIEMAAGARLRMRGDGNTIVDLPVWEAPTVTLTADHIIGIAGLRRGLEQGDTFNEIRAKYLEPANGYLAQEAEPWRDETSIALNGLQSTTLDLSWCPSHRQARAVQKLEAARRNPAFVATITTNAYGLNVMGEKTFTVELLGLTLVCEYTSFRYNRETATCDIGIRTISEAAMTLTTEEQGTAPDADETGSDAAIESPDLSVDVTGFVLTVTAETPDRDDLQFFAEYSVHDADEWLPIGVGLHAYTGSTGTIPTGTYDARGWFRSSSGEDSDFAEEDSVVVGTATPSAPTGSATPVSE